MKFIFEHYEVVSRNVIDFYYQVQQKEKRIKFKESLLLPEDLSLPEQLNTSLRQSLEAIHLVLGISYFKAYLAKVIEHNYNLQKLQADYFGQLYSRGLGEFFYANQLEPRTITFPFNIKGTESISQGNISPVNDNQVLLAFGGGKDSLVSFELLKAQGFFPTWFFIETSRTPDFVPGLLTLTKAPCYRIKRILDPKLSDSSQVTYSGHVPVSAIYAHIGVLVAQLARIRWVIASNEQSSNEGNLEYYGQEINHQWSKSSEFEDRCQSYVHQFIDKKLTYFSLLRPFNELKIAQMFASFPLYHRKFSSCNRQFSKDETGSHRWCNECPKCGFAFLMLSSFLKREEVIAIFGENLLAKAEMIPLYKDMLGLGKAKPFECVGTFRESQLALRLASTEFAADIVVTRLLPKLPLATTDLKSLEEEVYTVYPSPLIPTKFRLCGMKTLLLLGEGKEGKVSRSYFGTIYPYLQIEATNEQLNEDFYIKQQHCDLGIRSPGINPEKISMHYTTATNWFLAHAQAPVIGITGSKGKSTTTALIWHILARNGIKATMLGNMGKPMLSALFTKSVPDYYVVEFSSYQLADCVISPHRVVITALFPEHLDYHGSLENYYKAKQQVLVNQTTHDHYYFPEENQLLRSWADSGEAVAHPIKINNQIRNSLTLLGEHNLLNASLAAAVAMDVGLTIDQVNRGLATFVPLTHRLQFVGQFSGIHFYDDAISTTPESTLAALRALPQTTTLFLGGQDRGYDFKPLIDYLNSSAVKNLVLFPDSGKTIAKLLPKNRFVLLKTDRMSRAVQFAF